MSSDFLLRYIKQIYIANIYSEAGDMRIPTCRDGEFEYTSKYIIIPILFVKKKSPSPWDNIKDSYF